MINSINNQTGAPFTLLRLFLEWWMVLAAGVLLVVWALPHTIAARNIALISGALASLAWLWVVRPKIQLRNILPAILLASVIVWMLFHWLFISNYKEQQWDEIDSTWLRVGISIILAFGLGQVIARQNFYFLFIALAIVLLPSLTAVLYFYQVDLQDKWILDGFLGLFKMKFSGVYFILCQVFLGFGLVSYSFFGRSQTKIYVLLIGLVGSLLIISGIIDGIALRALNVILVSLLCFFIFLLFFMIRFSIRIIRERSGFWLLPFAIMMFAGILAALIAFYQYDQKYEQKFANLVGDIQIATQLEKNQTWIRDDRPMPWPVTATGRPINQSTYERISWFIRGAQFITQYPLGNGISHLSFGYYMRDAYPNSKALMTHSGWIDFALGVGLPGLFLTWLAILVCLQTCQRSLKTRNFLQKIDRDSKKSFNLKINNSSSYPLINGQLLNYCGFWLILGIAFYWIVGEVSEREYIENYFFLITFIASASQVEQSDKTSV